MKSVPDADLDELAPYGPAEFNAARDRVAQSPWLAEVTRAYFPHVPAAAFAAKLKSLPDVVTFQREIIGEAIRAMLEQTSRGQTIHGHESLPRSRKYLFISNHRDILLDPAIFSRSLLIEGHGTPQICLGDNLLKSSTIVDLVKMNKGITVKRDLSTRELFRWSHVLSALIHRVIASGRDSVWIAQAEGRAKDGNDRTHPGVLKMLTLCGKLEELAPVPVAISYEYDPCDHFKARECFLTRRDGKYQKADREDLQSMTEGIRGFKGRIHIEIGEPLTDIFREAELLPAKNEQIRLVAEAIDLQIHLRYRNWPSNFIAYDLLEGGNEMRAHYSEEERAFFVKRMQERLAKVASSPEEAREMEAHFLGNVCELGEKPSGGRRNPADQDGAAESSAPSWSGHPIA